MKEKVKSGEKVKAAELTVLKRNALDRSGVDVLAVLDDFAGENKTPSKTKFQYNGVWVKTTGRPACYSDSLRRSWHEFGPDALDAALLQEPGDQSLLFAIFRSQGKSTRIAILPMKENWNSISFEPLRSGTLMATCEAAQIERPARERRRALKTGALRARLRRSFGSRWVQI